MKKEVLQKQLDKKNETVMDVHIVTFCNRTNREKRYKFASYPRMQGNKCINLKNNKMKKVKLVLFVLVCVCSSLVQAKHTANKNIGVSKSNYIEADRTLNLTYQNLLFDNASDSLLCNHIKHAQRQWMLFRDAESVLFTPYTSPKKTGSSEIWYKSMTILSKRRTAILENDPIQIVSDSIWDEAFAEQRLNTSYKALLAKYSAYPDFITKLRRAQLAWIRYRNANGIYTKTITETRIRVLRQFLNSKFEHRIEHLYKKKRSNH